MKKSLVVPNTSKVSLISYDPSGPSPFYTVEPVLAWCITVFEREDDEVNSVFVEAVTLENNINGGCASLRSGQAFVTENGRVIDCAGSYDNVPSWFDDMKKTLRG